METSLQQLVEIFRNIDGFNRVFLLFRQKYRSYGRITKSTTVILDDPTSEELRVLNGFFGSAYGREETILVAAGKMEREIRNSKYRALFDGYDLNDFLKMYYGGELTSKSEDKRRYEAEQMGFFQALLSEAQMESLFYKFISFIKTYKNAPSVHHAYKKSPESLKGLLILLKNLFEQLPLNKDIYLPMLAYKLGEDYHALSPNSDAGKMMIFALQVLNHLDKDAEVLPKLEEEQIEKLLKEYGILFCPESNKLAQRLWISDDKNGQETRSYQLIPLRKIDRGSFAQVYRVFDPIEGREWACKVLFERSYFLHSYGKDGEEYLRRFKREIKLLRDDIDHPNIIEIDKIQLEHDPVLFTMPLATTSLDKWISSIPTASDETKLSIFKNILSGVAYLHQHPISHRDLAPQNILLFQQDDGKVVAKVADLGLAKDHRSFSSSTRYSQASYGREAFTAPEQKESLKNADALSDIYSLGALLYYIFSGTSPENRFKSFITYQHIVGKAMEDDRSKRYQTVQELWNDMMNSPLASGYYSFESLINYEFNDFTTDVNHVLRCLTTVDIGEVNKVLWTFIKPFISVPLNVLAECSRHWTVMVPFMHTVRNNIDGINCKVEEWYHVSLRIAEIYKGTQHSELRLMAVHLILVIALKKGNQLTQDILVDILSTLTGQGGLSQQIAYIIEKEFLSYHDVLIGLLKNTSYPSNIRFALNDF
ncbi:Serine/threonine-protein kinase PknD [Paenibacillus plantiphilus]|uniref:non-specific serine/threonine protein kinase n=1 Tax=Paenibacillus plantiphilus TaxID=2905650 RepID=A0ABM9CIK0_9BACL|nr:protein kinase [Paenibacillus plantiphilus]CAH1213247.1 Serine/threonine-protein kinase PknD [Paenibacillus plantiphilus]